MNKRRERYFDAYASGKDEQIICYRTWLTVYEEILRDGMLMGNGWNTSGFQLSKEGGVSRVDATKYLTEPSCFHLEIDGRNMDYGYRLASFSKTEGLGTLDTQLRLENTLFPIELTVNTSLDGGGSLVRSISVKNLSDRPMCLSRLAIFSGILDKVEKMYHTYPSDSVANKRDDLEDYFTLTAIDDGGWGREGELHSTPLCRGMTVLDMRYRRSKFRHPLMFLRNNVLGRTWYCQMAWTAGCNFLLDHVSRYDKNDSIVELCCELASHNPMLVINPGECFTSPEVHLGVVEGDLDDSVNQMHEHIRSVTPAITTATPCLVCALYGATEDMSVEGTVKAIKRTRDLGAEVFILDAGWQCPPEREREHRYFNGTNLANPDRYPDGLGKIADVCHENGMLFGLWTEIERIGEGSPVYREHPEWRGVTMRGKRSETYLDMSNPDAAAWAEEALAFFIKEYKLDLLRIDHINPGSVHFCMADKGTGINECLSVRHYMAVYAMYERLKKRFPGVIFENCAGGGGRTDLGIMKYFDHTWVSDNQILPRAAHIANGMTVALPPERVDRLFAGMQGYAQGSLDAQVRNAMLTHLSFEALAIADVEENPIQAEFVKHSIELYKSFIRPFLPMSRIYHHTAEYEKCLSEGAVITEISSRGGARGAITVITLPFSNHTELVIKPRGISPDKKYRVTLDNLRASFTVEGYELYSSGIKVSVPGAMCSELVTYEQIS